MPKTTDCAGQIPDGLEIDMVVDIMRHATRGPLFPSESVDPHHKVWKKSEYEQLTPQGAEESTARGQQVAECYEQLGLLEATLAHEIYIRSTNVPRAEQTAEAFMKGFAEEASLQVSKIKHTPGTPANQDSKNVIAIHVMPQSGIKRIGGTGDFLLESATIKWQERQEENLHDVETSDDEDEEPFENEENEPSVPQTKLETEIQQLSQISKFKGNIEHLSDMLDCSRRSGKIFMPEMPEDMQIQAIRLGEKSKMLKYETSLSNVCTKVHDLFQHIKTLFSSEPVSKYRLYVTHDTNIISALIMLQIPLTHYPPPLAAIKFERFHAADGKFFIRTSYNGDPVTSICSAAYCHVDAFILFIHKQLSQCVAIEPRGVRTL